ncbi:BA75_00063T0 [Komagataella pastoris]|uniref:BA75_00063T0 n=1 Tax=Komagataella pastoris TaxID=4922 RepID=A0A1B2J7A7_PICPA|nr:BA75_00063T0 [Komagataella pastoris]
MPVSSPAQTSTSHPAERLSDFVPEEFRIQLAKTPPRLTIEQPVYQDRLKEIRNNEKFAFIVQWLYLLRGVIKLYEEHFDVISFEEELIGINGELFLLKFKSNLVYALNGFKIQNVANHPELFNEQIQSILPNWFLEHYDSDEALSAFDFNDASIEVKLDIFYELLRLLMVRKEATVRKTVELYDSPWDTMKLLPVFAEDDLKNSVLKEYLILMDDRMYYREWSFPKIKVPAQRKEYLKLLDQYENPFGDLEPKIIRWECLTVGIYEFDEYLNNLKLKTGKKTSSKEGRLLKALEPFVEQIYGTDLKKRKEALHRKKELQLQSLLANRKRSSRLEAKERQREEEKRKEHDERIRQINEGTALRSSRRLIMKQTQKEESTPPTNTALSRADRLQQRRALEAGLSGTSSPMPVTPDENKFPPLKTESAAVSDNESSANSSFAQPLRDAEFHPIETAPEQPKQEPNHQSASTVPTSATSSVQPVNIFVPPPQFKNLLVDETADKSYEYNPTPVAAPVIAPVESFSKPPQTVPTNTDPASPLNQSSSAISTNQTGPAK